ncbi:MAG: T9SS type A sorting domain-containing protein [Bacteroidetes bacterium]|nr:T9SS type A sorting domain-containing protein [Bacteroidota bacterium]
MKKTFTLLLCCMAGGLQLAAQIPSESPITVEVRIESQDGLVKTFVYGRPGGWCDTLAQTVSGDAIWAYGQDSLGMQTDTLCCDSMIFNDLTGKIALIRRGDCEFGLKAFRAQQAGAIGVIILNRVYLPDPAGGAIGMGGGAFGSQVHIPTILLSKEDGDIILDKLNAGIPVTAIFEVRPFGGPRHAYSYHTPLSGVKPLEDVGITFVNTEVNTTIPSLTLSAEFTDPNGQTATISQTITDVAPLSLNSVTFDDSYTPSAIGEYTVVYSNSLTPDLLERKFIITDYTYALDDNDIIPNTNGTIEPDSARFVDDFGFRYDIGNFYRTGPTAQVATHASFMISNPDELFTGEPAADVFYINLYNADPDGNGSVPYPAAFASYSGLNENGGPLIPVASTEYVLSDTDEGFQFITVEFPNPVNLAPNKIYLLMIEYNGSEAASGIPPKYAVGVSRDIMAGGLGTVIFGDSLYTNGWIPLYGGNYNAVVRLHMDGFATSTAEPLDDSKVVVSPNPATSTVNLELSLDQVAAVVEVRILDFTGRMVSMRQLENVQDGTFSFDVSKMPVGNYFLSITTPEGFRSKKFQVAR